MESNERKVSSNDRTPQQFLAQWLWSSPKRTTVDEGWSDRHKADVCQMLVDYLEYSRKGHETKSPQRIYRHLKTNNAYEVLFDAFDATNAREGKGAVVYRRIGHTAVYVRDASEFHEKFVSTGESSEKAEPQCKHLPTQAEWCPKCKAENG